MNNNIDALIFAFVVTFYSFWTCVFFDFIPPDLPPTCHSDRRSFRSRILRLRTFCPEKVCPERFSFYYRGLFCQSCFLQHEGRFYLTNGIREGLRTLEECLGSNSKIRYDFCAGRRIITDLSVESPYCSMSLDSKHTQP